MTWKKSLLVLAAAAVFVLYSPTLLDFRPTAFRIPFSPLKGPLEQNDELSKAEQLFKDNIYGPESIVVKDGIIYTGTKDGRIVKIHDNKITTVAQTGQDCHLPYEGRLCGRPLGLRMGRDGLLYFLDAFYGLHRVNISNGLLTRLLPNNVLIEGVKITFPDDLDIDENGNVYISDASAKWDLSYVFYLLAEFDGSGRVLRFNVNNGESEVLLKGLHFPNGIQISHDGNSLLISETSQRRILRYYLKGPRKGEVEVLIDQLPAEPDNIRLSSNGGYWIGLASARNETNPNMLDMLGQYPLIRRAWMRLQHGVGSIIMAAGEMLSSHTIKEFAHNVQRGYLLLHILPRHGIVIEINDKGNIVRNYQAPDGRICHISEVTEHDGYIYLGSFVNHYLGRLKI